MESFDAYVEGGDDVANTRPFDDDGYTGFDPRLPSQRFDSFRMSEESYGEEHYTQQGSRELGDIDEDEEFGTHKEHTGSNEAFDAMGAGSEVPPPYHSSSSFDTELGDGHSPSMSSNFGQSFESRLQPDFSTDEFSSSMDSNGKGHDDSFAHGKGFGYGFPPGFRNGGAALPPPDDMQAEEGFILREWKRKNAIHLEEKARNEREQLSQIIDAADGFKDAFKEKWRTHCETTKKNNREKEKVFLEAHKEFHATANKHYWKAVAELIPHEIPTMEAKSRGKKDQKKPAVVINHGPKPGKATDLTRMRQVLVKLKHNPPAHMKPPPPPSAAPPAAAGAEGADAKASASSAATTSAPAPEPLQMQGIIPTAPVA